MSYGYDRPSQWNDMDKMRRKLSIKYELKKRLLRSVLVNKQIPFISRYNAYFRLSLIPHLGSHMKIRNRCITSGRSYNVIRKTRYCRFVFRHNAYFSNLPGVRRSSW